MEKVMTRKATRRPGLATRFAAAQSAGIKVGGRIIPRQIGHASARQWLRAIALSLLVLAPLSSVPAQANTAAASAQVNILQTRGQTAYAQYVQYTDNFCAGLSVEVFAGSDLSRYNQTRTGGSSIFVQLVGFNACTGTFSFMSGSSTDVALKFAPDLSPIDAAGTVIVTDGTDSRTVNVALHWEGGTLTSTKTKTVNTSPQSTTTFKQIDGFRSDTAVNVDRGQRHRAIVSGKRGRLLVHLGVRLQVQGLVDPDRSQPLRLEKTSRRHWLGLGFGPGHVNVAPPD
jgi:hypothetical protein